MKGFTEVSERELNEIDGGFWGIFTACAVAVAIGIAWGAACHFISD
jgi:lactobin A/cerein 7B family class IIb bacteriocin